jgi:protein-tyrosine kinase
MAPAEQLVSLVAPASMEADQYRGLRHTVERMRRDAGLQMLAVTSPGAGDGKTITTLNLAGSLAQSPDTRVLVVDADLHRPSVAEYLGLDDPHGPGLVDVIVREECKLAQTVRRLERLNLSVLPSGVCESGVYELLNSPRIESILVEARRDFDFVLIDTPPLVPLPDCRILGQWVDGFMIVVTAHRTPRRALAEALNLLDPAKLIGLVFNADDRPLTPYSSYYGYSGSKDGPSQASRSGSSWWRRALASGPDHGGRPAAR